MKALVKAVLVAASLAIAGTAAAQVVSTDNTKSRVTQSQGGLLNKQVGTIGSAKAGSGGVVVSRNSEARLTQSQGGLLNSQAGHIGSSY